MKALKKIAAAAAALALICLISSGAVYASAPYQGYTYVKRVAMYTPSTGICMNNRLMDMICRQVRSAHLRMYS